ncbi:MAG: polysaccharide pyruvyl transferase family protein, partial [Oscillospiraceae bacterium]
MRLAIVTVYDSIVNYGSYLQAYALNKVLINMGHEVYFIERMEEKEILNRFDNLCVIQNQIPKNRNLRKLRQISRKIKIKREQLANIHRFNQFKNDWKEFKIINISEIKNYKIDALICGSDEIWNINNKDIDFNFYSCEWEHSLPKLAYAISSGTTKKEELLQLKGSIDAIGDFDIILPRDNATQQLILKITGQNCNEVCDPTILLGRDNYPQINCEKNYGNYLLVYSYYIRKKERAFILKYAKEHKLKIISPCIYFEDADENIFVPSLEFPTLIKNANCVFTTTFHGTIFSLMFAKRLCCLSRLPKISDLIEKCNAKNTILPENASYEQFCEIMSNDLDHIEIESQMSEMKQLSKSCLLDGLNQLENKKHKPIGTLKQTYPKIYYGKTCNNDVLKKSSSGGLFYELAQSVLKDGGVVFGAVYNAQKHLVYHESTEKVALNDLMRSKYVESQIGNTYQQIIDFLKEGRKV